MKDDIQRILEGLTPRGAPAELRRTVLGAVVDELAATRRSPARQARWDARIGGAVAASLMLGVVLNVWAIRSDNARQARLYGPEPVPREICQTVETIENVAGPECAASVRQRLVRARQSLRRDDRLILFRHRQQFMQLLLTKKGITHAHEDSQVDRHHSGQSDCGAVDRQRDLCVA